MLSKSISSISLFIVGEMTENPTVGYVKFWFHSTLLINFGHASVIVSVARNLFSDLVLFQLKSTYLKKFKKSLLKKNIKRNL